ncbi:MAG: hypothetical protein RL088_1033 [Verrucomicrobiota bacterium]|jgi:hypothetical protein
MKRTIPLESATKAELIEAIKLRLWLRGQREDFERDLHSVRCRRLLAEMKAACDDMDANQQTGEGMDWSKHARWAKANDRWNRANNELSKLQGA